MCAHTAAALSGLTGDRSVAVLGVVPADRNEPVAAVFTPAGEVARGKPSRQIQIIERNEVIKSGTLRQLRLPGLLIMVRDKGYVRGEVKMEGLRGRVSEKAEVLIIEINELGVADTIFETAICVNIVLAPMRGQLIKIR